MITVATCNHPTHAQLLKSVLEDSGIPALLPDEFTVQNAPHLIFAIGGIRVQVPEDQAEAARIIVAQIEQASPGSDTSPPVFS